MRNFANNNSRLLRSSLVLSELDFGVENRVGSKIVHANALIQYEGSVTLADSLDKKAFLVNMARAT